MAFLKRVLFWGVLAGILYFFLSFHVIFIGKSFKLLKKSELSLNYTFFSANGKSNKAILRVDVLREDGIADILVETGLMSEQERELLLPNEW